MECVDSWWEPQRYHEDANCTPIDWAQALVGSLLRNSFHAKQAMEGLGRLYQANLDQGLGRRLDLMDSHAAVKKRREKLELDQISTSDSWTREKEAMREEENEITYWGRERLGSLWLFEKTSWTGPSQGNWILGKIFAKEKGPFHLSCQKLELFQSPKIQWLSWKRNCEVLFIGLQIQEPDIREIGFQGEKPLKHFALNQLAHKEEVEKAAQPSLIELASINVNLVGWRLLSS